MKWLRANVRTVARHIDAARAALLIEGVNGWEEEEDGPAVGLVFYYPVTDGVAEGTPPTPPQALIGLVSRIREMAQGDAVDLQTEWVDDEDWAHAWKRFWKPQRIGRNFIVSPSWEAVEPGPEDHLIRLDPGMAFGTGTHETTRMCLEWIEKAVQPGDRVLDIGTGSGILTVAALMRGAAHAVAIDSDPVATHAAVENIAVNGYAVEGFDSVADVRLGHGWAPVSNRDGRFNVIVANLVTDAIIELAPGICAHLARGGRFIGSGIIIERLADVRAALEAHRLPHQIWQTMGEWASVEAREL